MHCPKCTADMEIVSYDEIKVDRCTGCKGLWFQPQELSTLRNDAWMADYILDEGDARTGKRFNRIDAIHCPHCNEDMRQEFDQEQPTYSTSLVIVQHVLLAGLAHFRPTRAWRT